MKKNKKPKDKIKQPIIIEEKKHDSKNELMTAIYNKMLNNY